MFLSRKSIVTIVMSVSLIFAVSGAGSCGGDGGKPIEFTILHTNDLHSHFRAEPSNSEKNPYNLGGYARLKTLVDQLRAKKKNTLLLDGGDYSEANTYFHVDAGTNALRIMDAIGYDAVVVGNHDFLTGPVELPNSIERANPRFPLLGANKSGGTLDDSSKERLFNHVKDYTILTVGAVKVGIIGLLTNEFTYSAYFKPAILTNPVETATRLAKKLHDEKLADVIVLLSHNQFELNKVWAKQIPWVNVIVSGHSHRKTAQPFIATNGGDPVYLVEAKEWGQFLGDLTLVYDPATGKTKMKNYTLHPVSSDIAENPAIAAMIDEEDRKLAEKYGKDIVHDHAADCTDEMAGGDERESPLANLSVDAYLAATGAEIAMDAGQLSGVGLQPGPLSSKQLMDVAPHIYQPFAGDASKPFPQFGHAWTLKKISMKGVDIRGLLELVMLAQAFDLPLGWIPLSGAQVTYSKTLSGSPVKTIKVLNRASGVYEPLSDDRRYIVTMHDGLLLAAGLLIEKLALNIDLTQIEETGIETGKAVLDFASKKGTIRAVDFEAGTRYRTLETDLGFYEHSVQVRPRMDGKGWVVAVAVLNEGLVASNSSYKLRVSRNEPDDAVRDSTPDDKTTPISNEVAIPPLNPGDRTIVELPWTNLPKAGVYRLNVALSDNDGNPKNNSVSVHAKIPAVK